MKNKKLLIFGIILIIIGGITLSTVHNLEISKKENKKQYKETIKQEKEKLYKLNDDGTIYFKDKNLEKAIKEETKLDTLTPESVKNVEVLFLGDNNIKSLVGIEYFDNLFYLNLSKNYINNVDILKELKKLDYLSLNDNCLTNAESLSKIKNLKTLDISFNHIKDISPLKELKELDSIPITYHNPILNLEVLEENLDMYEENLKNKDYYEINTDEGSNDYIIKRDFSNEVISDCEKSYVECTKEIINKQNRKEIKTYKKAMKIARDFIKENINDKMSDIEKEAIISNFIMNKVRYEKTDGAEDGIPDDGTHNLYFTMVENRGQCNDYSIAFTTLGTMAGLETYSAVSTVHAWNIVKIDGRFYHIDLTWEDEDFMGTYINVSTKTMNALHGDYGGKYSAMSITEKFDISKDMDRELVTKHFVNKETVQ